MRAFEYHPLSKITVKERLIFRMSYGESAWMLAGLMLAAKMSDFVPKLPLPNVAAYVHYSLPVLVCAVFAFIRHSSDMTFLQYFRSLSRYKKRKKTMIGY